MKSGCFKRLFYVGIVPVCMGLAAWQGWSWWSWASAPAQAPTPETVANPPTVQIQIPEGTPSQHIGQILESAGLIRSTTAWDVWTKWHTLRNKSGGFQAGTYALTPTEPLETIANQIWSGQVVQLSFTIPEGWNRGQMAAALESQGLVTAADFLAATELIPYDQYPWLPKNLPHLEGFLYPDTYQLPGGVQVSAQEIVNIMLARFEEVALPIYQQSGQQSPYTLLEWVTLASIVEKETVVSEERDTIASVFAKRLREGITLGADPTVEYGLGITQTPENPLTLDQVNTPNPYNTYINAGLPPTPISSPSAPSLKSSMNPAETEYLYFVARYDGTHVFSRTLGEHETAQAQIRDRIDAQPGAGN
jgi:UPF0755 protein